MLENLQYEIEQYTRLKYKVLQAIKYLNNAIVSLETASNTIATAFTINDESADLKSISKKREELINRKNFLSGVVLMAIDSKNAILSERISELSEDIASAE